MAALITAPEGVEVAEAWMVIGPPVERPVEQALLLADGQVVDAGHAARPHRLS